MNPDPNPNPNPNNPSNLLGTIKLTGLQRSDGVLYILSIESGGGLFSDAGSRLAVDTFNFKRLTLTANG